MQEQDKEFKIGQKVRYIGGDDCVDPSINSDAIGYVDDIVYCDECVYIRFEKFPQLILKSCLEIVE